MNMAEYENLLEFRIQLFVLVQLLLEAGYKCWQASDGISVHFNGGKMNSALQEQMQKCPIRWWPKDWEQRILG